MTFPSSQILIIKFCGKKTPLVRRKRRGHQRTVHHDTENPNGNNIDCPDIAEVQVHPVAIEAAVPFGKKVRLGENRKKKKKRRKSKEDKTKGQDQATEEGQVEQQDDVGRAHKLAANLSQLIVNLPPEDNVERDVARRGRSSENKARSSRPHKSLSPEKKLRSALGDAISKSFEKLDKVGGGAEKSKSGGDKADRLVDSADKADDKGNNNSSAPDDRHKRKRRRISSRSPGHHRRTSKKEEVTLAKLGRFKFSLEVNNRGAEHGGGGGRHHNQHQRRHQHQRREESRKRSKLEHHKKSKAEDDTTEEATVTASSPDVITPEAPEPPVLRPDPLVHPNLEKPPPQPQPVISKRPPQDRPLLWLHPSPTRQRSMVESQEMPPKPPLKFKRSISSPGPTPEQQGELIATSKGSQNQVRYAKNLSS